MKRNKILFFLILIIFSDYSYISTQDTTISREMEQAIRLYQEGKDNDAMDRFMDIMFKGTPSEKSLANEYINKITLRMNTGTNNVEESNTSVQKIDNNKQINKEPEQYIEKGVLKESEPENSRELIAFRVNKKISEMKKEILLSIGKLKSFKIFMSNNETPVGVLINNDEIFSTGTNFKPQAIDNLQVLSSLFFTLGKASIMIIPKGGVTGEIEIANIRRAIAINSYLISRGISPSRLNVNLTGTNIILPKEINNMDGTLCVIDYKKEPVLKSENDPKTGGPNVSLGIYPTSIATYKNEGAIIEFSVFEGEGGLPSWKFQIYQLSSDNSMLLIQEIHGEGAKYNQTFFNGREKFFGAPYTWGKYLFSITAKDLNGKETTEKRLLFIKPSPEEEKKLASKPKETKKEITNSNKESQKDKNVKNNLQNKKNNLIKSKKSDKTKNLKKLASKKAIKSSDKNKENEKENKEENIGQVVYKIYFEPGTINITANSIKKLEQISKTLESYPDTSILVTGYSYKDEKNNKIMAKKRADITKKTLIEKYNVDKKRIKITTKISSTLKTIAEIKIIQE